jgi:hypothetical protein
VAAALGQGLVIRTREIKDLTVGLATKIGGQALVNRYADRRSVTEVRHGHRASLLGPGGRSETRFVAHKAFERWMRVHHDYSHGVGSETDEFSRFERCLLLSMG